MIERRLFLLALLVLLGIASTALPAAAASKVVVYYAGTETSGSIAKDRSGLHNNGSLHDVRLNGSAYVFNPTSSYIKTPSSTSINPGTSNFSYSVAIKISASTTFGHDLSLVRRGSAKFPGAYYKMEMVYTRETGNMRLVCAVRDTAGRHAIVSTSGNTLNDGVWHTLTCAKTAKRIRLTKDGVSHSNVATLGSLSSTRRLFFGAERIGPHTYWEHFPGRMKDIILTKG